ncbi:MAG: PPC domain-containing protein, partial [Bacteroidota bacterium]
MKQPLPKVRDLLLFTVFFLSSISLFAQDCTEFVPPNDPTGMVFSTTTNDGYTTGRGLIFEVMSNVTVGQVGLFHDVTGVTISFNLAEINGTTGDVRVGQNILVSGSQTFTTTGLEFVDFTFTPITLVPGQLYHLEFSHPDAANQNFFYDNDNVAWMQGDFMMLEGTQNGTASNFVVSGMRICGPSNIPPVAATFNMACDGVEMASQSGTVNSDLIWYEFIYDGSASVVTFNTAGSDHDTEIGLYDASGNLIESDDDGLGFPLSLIERTDLTAGTYYVVTGDFNTTFGATDFNVTAGSGGGPNTVNISLNCGPEIVATVNLDCGSSTATEIDPLASGEVILYEVIFDDLTFGGVSLTADTEGSDFDTELGLYDAAGTLLAVDDDGGTGLLSLVSTNAGFEQGDTFYVAVGGFNTIFDDDFVIIPGSSNGTATVNFEVVCTDVPVVEETVTIDCLNELTAQATGEIDSDLAWFAVNFQGYGTGDLVVNTEGSTNDTELGLYDSAGNLIDNDDDGGTGLLSMVSAADLPAGTYYVVVGDFNTSFGSTGFSVSPGTGGGDIVVNFAVEGCEICQDVTVSLDADGMASVDPDEVVVDENDVLPESAVVSLSQSDFTCDDLGDNTVTATVSAQGLTGFGDGEPFDQADWVFDFQLDDGDETADFSFPDDETLVVETTSPG